MLFLVNSNLWVGATPLLGLRRRDLASGVGISALTSKEDGRMGATKTYRVTLVRRETMDIWVQAEDEDNAEDLALRLFDRGKIEADFASDSGLSGEVELCAIQNPDGVYTIFDLEAP